jgi:hypothetical protein
MTDNQVTEQWGTYEIVLDGPADGNPYLDLRLSATFSFANRKITVPGFHDGGRVYRVRFMPDERGTWTFETHSNAPALDGQHGHFLAVAPSPGNHGPVRVRNRFHFAYADGEPYFPFGTTCYAWTHQPLDQQAQTLETLKKARFNKLRMGVFPKDYPYNVNPPLHACFLAGPDGKEDLDRPNPAHFQHLDAQVRALRDLGIEADLILFHPYDRWGYCNMSAAQDYRYVAYVAARLAAFRNVWWSLANEYDFLLDTKPLAQWDRYFHLLEEHDPVRHLKSIHNGDVTMNFDHRKPWVDHVCIQNPDVKRTQEWRDAYGKPVVNDEPEYEGNIVQAWGNLPARELVHRLWVTVMRGGYAGHGETFVHPQDLLWWAKGGVLRGEAWKRFGFLRGLLEEDVKNGLTPIAPTSEWPWSRVSGAIDGDVRYVYFGEHQPVIWAQGFPQEDGDYQLDLIDPWEMTVTPLKKVPAPQNHPTRHGGIIRGRKPDAAFGVELPGKPYLAVRVRQRRS